MKRLILFVVFLSFNLTANSILIKSGQIHDGQGNSFIGDILITDNKIVEVVFDVENDCFINNTITIKSHINSENSFTFSFVKFLFNISIRV